MTPAAFLTSFAEAIANDGALILLVLLILFLGARKTWVWGYQLTAKDEQLKDEQVRHMGEMSAMRSERDNWRSMALMREAQRGPESGHPHESRQAPEP
jgi:hypothetical protein